MFDDLPSLQLATFGRPGFQHRKQGRPGDLTLTGIWLAQHSVLDMDKRSGVTFESTVEAVSVLTTAADASSLVKGDLIAPPHQPTTFRQVGVRRDDGFGMSLLVLRRVAP